MGKMTDRELLERAAKAAGFGGPENKFCWTESEYPRGSDLNGALWNYVGHMDSAVLWNPLTDDGDAFRLALKLRINVEHMAMEIMAHKGDVMCVEPNDDVYAAARRVIVLAAAEIAGK